MLSAGCFYAVYYVTYKTRLRKRVADVPRRPLFTMNRVETNLTWVILMGIALVSVGIFFMHNGFLLFRLNSYSQIFSSEVSGVALKRFFYFFIPAMLVVYFLRQDSKAWLFFLVSTVAFGLLTYMIVGGTRANIIIAFAIFLFIGIIRGWISLWMLAAAGVLGIVGMFWLALKRYGMNVSGDEAFYTFLYLTRDTFSPWENLALLLQNYDNIDFQGLAPIVRDFYVFIPSWLWPGRPSMVLNSANYFTWEVLNNHSGLAISPTLIGSLVVMGGALFIPLGAIVVGLIIKWFDWLYELGKAGGVRDLGQLVEVVVGGQPQEAANILNRYTFNNKDDSNGWDLLAQAEAALNNRDQELAARAEGYALAGRLDQAISLLSSASSQVKLGSLQQARYDARIDQLRQLQERFKPYTKM